MLVNHRPLGNGARYANEYPLMTTTGVYEGQREASDQKRVFIFSRSGYAGVSTECHHGVVWRRGSELVNASRGKFPRD